MWDIAQVEHAYKRVSKVEAADLSILPSPRKNWQTGARNDTLNKKVYDLAVSGTATKDDYMNVLKQAKASGLTDAEIAATFNSAKKSRRKRLVSGESGQNKFGRCQQTG